MLACGFGGFRDHQGQFTFDPRLPAEWEGLSYRLTLHGTRVRVTVLPDQIEFLVEDQQPDFRGELVDPTFVVRGESVTVSAGAPVVVPLADQGPIIEGSPPPVRGRHRADGTTISAIVPGA